jgi:hypothetical protein
MRRLSNSDSWNDKLEGLRDTGPFLRGKKREIGRDQRGKDLIGRFLLGSGRQVELREMAERKKARQGGLP